MSLRRVLLLLETGKSMIEYKKGDILCEDVEALVNPVNCVGVMGEDSLFNSRKHSRKILRRTLLGASATKCSLGECSSAELVNLRIRSTSSTFQQSVTGAKRAESRT